MNDANFKDTIKSSALARRLVLLVPALLWLAFTLLGLGLLRSVWDQGAEGYPNGSQIGYYFVGPAIGFVALIALTLFARRLSMTLCVGIGVAAMLALPVFLFVYTGGV